ncbi:MAG: AAA family ATPase, partial [Cyanobacteria bacterium REEB65]|nr:AAA family ATPase [Cyanobacteria bacterium REEB65]
MTVLFADVEGFTSLSARLDPERVTEILNAFFKVLAEPVYRCGGVVDKYMGDAIMALFGAPIAHEDDPERAVLAALELQRAARQFAAELESQTGISLAVRVGVNTGLVVAGAVGSGAKRDYTVMGDAVNVARRLETAAARGTVLVGESTYNVTRDRFDFEWIGPLVLKGIPDPVVAYRALGARPIARAELRERTPLVGRQSELTRLLTCLDNLKNGSPQVVGLVGEAGIGKSRLAREFLARIRSRGEGRLLRASCPSYGRDHPLRLLVALLSAWLDLDDDAPDQAYWAALNERAMHAGHPDAASAAALLSHLLGRDPADSAAERLTPRQRRNAAFLVLNDLLVAEARRQPLFLAIDDLHWVDAGSFEWLDSFIDRLGTEPGPLPVLVFFQARPATEGGFTDWAGKVDLTQIVLRPLSADHQRALVGAALGLPGTPALWPSSIVHLSEQLMARAEGNPLFLWELLKGLLDGRTLVRGELGWDVIRPLADVDLPTSIKGVVAARLDALPQALRNLLQVAAVIGRNFTAELLSAVVGGEISNLLAELVAADFFHRRENGEFAFNQAVIHEVAYESLLIATRRELHRKVGEALESLCGDRHKEHADVLAYHFRCAEVPAKASEYLYRSGQRALRAFANGDALKAFQQALAFLPGTDAPVPRVDILAGLAEVEVLLGDYASAQTHVEEAIALQTEPRALADLHCLLARNLDRQGAYQDSLGRLAIAITDLGEREPAVIPRLLLEKSWIA